MDVKELCLKYGVPSPETCRELEWEQEPVFKWVYIQTLEGGKWDVCLKKILLSGVIEYVHAPQFHEIWAKLPEKIFIKDILYALTMQGNRIFYETLYNSHPASKLDAENNNLAEAAAKLYLQLKQAGKL